ncbi:DNA double-strand break repair ATPase Rad50 [Natronorubrum daqingense]|uniref:DNA double-strand break repair Rad50 ATPase n=1 Tax=Natronorubrum daqingense TaxID=588898 RepID=A0A1N6Y3P3_9EURY|nr:DNA double-strand break repair ATPase Rad50 [Natronorubrum daqingense]APX95788.1 chromosome segregation protein [Natronorubrum daqingense]SIR09242.1 exonuclease SbcC [Natronorubrum daqingense]
MKVDRIRLLNFKCYGDADLELDRGVTVVHGVNGSGKSTLLEGVFFALYGSKALADRTLDDVITTGEEESEIELWFTHDGRAYHVERHLKLRGDRATTTKCVLETPTESIEGARDVRREVTTLLRMDAEAFVNCAYVRQGEVNKLIHASPSDRQDMIDDLLQLGALEEYRERASDARLGVKTVLDGQREVLENVRQQVEEKEDGDLHDRLNALESRNAELTKELDNYETQREQARETFETANDVLERHAETREEIEELDEEIDDFRSKISETERQREDAHEEIREKSDRREELDDEREALLSDVDLDVDRNVNSDDGDDGDDTEDADGSTLEAVESRTETLEDRDDELRDDLEDVRVEITETNSDIERLRDDASDLESQAETAREDAEDLASKLETDKDAIEEREEKLDELDGKIETERERFSEPETATPPQSVSDSDGLSIALGDAEAALEALEADREDLTDKIGDITADIRTIENAIEEGETLLEEGKCPECGQSVEDSPHVDVLSEKRDELAERRETLEERETEREALDERIERVESLREAERQVDRLEENRDNIARLLEEKRETISDRREQREQLRADAEEYEADAEDKRERADELEESVDSLRGDLGEINGERSEIREMLERLSRVVDVETERSELASGIETLRERRDDWQTMNDERRETLSGKRERKRDLESEFDDERVETARQDKRDAEDYLEKVDAKLEDLREARTEVQNEIGAVERELEELEELRDRVKAVEARCERLQSLYDEAETLQATYADLRAELRQHNVETLDRLLNETFELVYQNDSYAGIDLDGEYRLTVYQKDGEALEPEQLSGGERALFNLSLRCAIYRLLAEGVEGAAPMPPLILDEPTVFLDSGHITQLVSLVESMREHGVEQIVVVSHDEELVGAADSLVRVRKDATSNRSRLERGRPPEIDLLVSD